MAEQLGVADPSCVKRYTERAKTKFDHQWEIRRERGLQEFTTAEEELRAWVAARSWTSREHSIADLAELFEVSRATVYRVIERAGANSPEIDV